MIVIKVSAFINAYTDYQNALTNYKNELNKFDTILKQVRSDHDRQDRVATTEHIKYSNYKKTADNVIMKKTTSNADDLDSYILDLDKENDNNYVSDKTYFNYKNLSNQFIQYNPHDELQYQAESVYTNNLKILNNNDIVDLSQNGDCDDIFETM